MQVQADMDVHMCVCVYIYIYIYIYIHTLFFLRFSAWCFYVLSKEKLDATLRGARLVLTNFISLMSGIQK